MDSLNCNGISPISDCAVELLNKDLWRNFHKSQTEMIITKSGRRLFPVPAYKTYDLDPMQDYCVYLEIILVAPYRFKYSPSVGWTPAGPEETQSAKRLYLHPESPAKGSHWMSKDITFEKLKVTNTSCNPPADQIVLSSMHLYQPRLLIAKTTDPQALGVVPMRKFLFPETEFFGVTAYQNKNIVRLKIQNNPYAKGFLKNEKCGDKRECDDDRSDTPDSKRSVPLSSPQPELDSNVNTTDSEVFPTTISCEREDHSMLSKYDEWRCKRTTGPATGNDYPYYRYHKMSTSTQLTFPQIEMSGGPYTFTPARPDARLGYYRHPGLPRSETDREFLPPRRHEMNHTTNPSPMISTMLDRRIYHPYYEYSGSLSRGSTPPSSPDLDSGASVSPAIPMTLDVGQYQRNIVGGENSNLRAYGYFYPLYYFSHRKEKRSDSLYFQFQQSSKQEKKKSTGFSIDAILNS